MLALLLGKSRFLFAEVTPVMLQLSLETSARGGVRFEAAVLNLRPRPSGLGRAPVSARAGGPTQQAPSLNPHPARDTGSDVSRGNSTEVEGQKRTWVRGAGGSDPSPAVGAANEEHGLSLLLSSGEA